jgi:hypothetical protein
MVLIPTENHPMTKSTRLNDLQLILLSHAAKHKAGHALPLPAAAAGDAERASKELKALLRRGLLVEAEVADAAASWRTDDSGQRIGLLISGKGREAIGVGDEADGLPSATKEGEQTAAAPAPRKASKQDAVIALLRRPEGATLAEMIEATGWLPHSTRAVLTGLRKKGHVLDKSKRDDATCYRIVEAA